VEGAVLDNGCDFASNPINWDFDWSSVGNATRYQIYVIGPSAANPTIDEVVTSSSYHYSSSGIVADSDRVGWRWRVRAGNSTVWGSWSAYRSFDVESLNTDCTFPTPDLYIPAEGATMDNGCDYATNSIVWYFDWDTLSNATRYQIYVIGPSAANPAINEVVTSSSYNYDSGGGYIADADRLGWRWRVRAGTSTVWGNWSAYRSFNVEPVNTDCPPSSPILYLPPEGAIMDNGCQSIDNQIVWDFDWSSVYGATRYRIYVKLPAASLPIIDDIVTSSSYHFASSPNIYIPDENLEGWQWWVRAGRGSIWGEWSPSRSFDVEPVNTDCYVY
jgi:hypothetical protein